MQDDAALLYQYAKTGSQEAFSVLVRRHLNLVYSAALRQVAGDAHLAEEVAQSVFHDLARKAAALVHIPVLAGWLHTSTHFAAAKVVRGERRRRAREAGAHAMQEILNDSARDAEWARIRPVLDELLRRLSVHDRDAILLRFFEGEAFARIGERLRLSENAARMRVERALEKLRKQLQQRGISSTSVALATVLASEAVAAAPTPLALSVTHAALAGGAGGSGAALSLFQSMAITKTQALLAAALLLGGGTAIVRQQRTQAALRAEIQTLNADRTEVSRREAEKPHLTSLSSENKPPQSDAERAAAELARLREEAAALREKQRAIATRRPASGTVGNRSNQTEESGDATQKNQPDHMPVAKFQVSPVFPPEMQKAGITGKTVVRVVINSKGEIQNASVVKSTHVELEAPVLEAIKQWKFDPGTKGGRYVNTAIEIPFVFNVEPVEPNWF